jgi:hypothetical protein
VRAREWLQQPTIASPRRLLVVPKANYGTQRETELFLVSDVFLSASDASATERQQAERETVLAVAIAMIDKGVRIVRANGNGQKAKDVAKEVAEKHGLKIDTPRVLDILNGAEREGKLIYVSANRNHHISAGFERGPQSPGGPSGARLGQKMVVAPAEVETALARLSSESASAITTHVLAFALAGPGAGDGTVKDFEKVLRWGAERDLAPYVLDRGGQPPGDTRRWGLPTAKAGETKP